MYNLASSMTDRIKFDEMAERAAEATLLTLDEKTALDQDAQEYAEFSWDEWLDVENQVDDIEEAKARYIAAFAGAVDAWQKQQLQETI